MKLRKNKLPLISLVAVLTIGLAAGTWAYFSQALSFENEFTTGKYNTKIVEEFEPPSKWVPGVEIQKRIHVKNTGNVPVVIRASFEEAWTKTGENLPNRIDTGSGEEDTVFKKFSTDVVELDDFGGNIANALDAAANAGKWLHTGTKTDKLSGKYYYLGVVDAGQQTPYLLESATMNPKLMNKVISEKEEVTVNSDGTKKVTTTKEESLYGFDDAKYKLTVTAETVQATKAAILELFGNTEFVQAFVAKYGA